MKIVSTFDTAEYTWVTYAVPSNNGPTVWAWDRVLSGVITEDGEIMLLTPRGWVALEYGDSASLETEAQYALSHPKAPF